MKKLTNYIGCILLLMTSLSFAQNFDLTKDTLIIKNPVMISIKNKNGFFIANFDDIKGIRKICLKKLFKQGKIYLVDNDVYKYLNVEQNKVIYYKGCEINEPSYYKGIYIRKFDKQLMKFIVGKIKLKYYDEKVITVDKGRTLFKDSDEFVKILFPLCYD